MTIDELIVELYHHRAVLGGDTSVGVTWESVTEILRPEDLWQAKDSYAKWHGVEKLLLISGMAVDESYKNEMQHENEA